MARRKIIGQECMYCFTPITHTADTGNRSIFSDDEGEREYYHIPCQIVDEMWEMRVGRYEKLVQQTEELLKVLRKTYPELNNDD